MKITLHSLREAEAPIRLGDVSYFRPDAPSPAQFGRFGRWVSDKEWFLAIKKKSRVGIPDSTWGGFIALELLKIEFENTRLQFSHEAESHEPSWLGKLPKFARYYIRREYLRGEGADPLAIIKHIPYMGFGYLIHEGGLADEACQVFNLHRLNGVRQLAFLHDPVLRENDRSAGALMFDHTRYCHVLDTYAVSCLVANNCRLNELEANTLKAAAISHDALTPAGGDTTKLVDPPAFDEDANYPELLTGSGWNDFQAKWRLDRTLLADTIRGKGKLGKLLDICDKMSYISRDCMRFLGKVTPDKYEGSSSSHYAIASLVRENPLVTKLWDEVCVWKDEVVIRNADVLYAFLKLRALLFKYLYYNPFSRFFEYLVGRGVTKYLYDTGVITRKDLLTEGDYWLEKKIDEFFGVRYIMRGLSALNNSRIEEYSDLNSAYERVAEFDLHENVLAIVDNFSYVSNSSTRKFRVQYRGEPTIFAVAYPDWDTQISSIMSFDGKVRVYFFNCDDLGIPVGRRSMIKKAFALMPRPERITPARKVPFTQLQLQL